MTTFGQLNVADNAAKDVAHFGERVSMKRPAQLLARLGGETTAA